MCLGSPSTTQKTNQTTRRTPYGPATAGLNTAIRQATDIVNQPGMFTPTFSDPTRAALEQGVELAGQPTAVGQYFQPVVAGGAQDYLTGAEGLRATATGDPTANPYYQAMRDQSAQALADRINAQFSGAGRYGSGAHTGTLTRGVGELMTGMDYDAWNAAMARRDAAQRALYGGGAEIAGQAGRLTDAELQRLGVLQEAGRGYDVMDEAIRTAPMRAAEWGMGRLGDIGQAFGTTRTRGTTTQSQNIPIGNQILGGAMALGGLFGGGMGGLGSAGGFGSLLGGFR